AMNGHFVNTEQAERFATALKKTFSEILSDEHYKQMFLDSIVVQSEDDQSLTYKKWETLKNMSED
ncbi:hypothetical protein JXB31_01440, partial [Candidatus Woesearchaeota archaeon]|nr:hypothetical protein [Candidatus Woesearchaeota archaeon]